MRVWLHICYTVFFRSVSYLKQFLRYRRVDLTPYHIPLAKDWYGITRRRVFPFAYPPLAISSLLWYTVPEKDRKGAVTVKKCKLFFGIVVLLGVLFSLSGCIVLSFDHYYDDIDKEKLSSVEFYDLRGSENFSIALLYTLPEDQTDAFLEELAKIRFEETMVIVLAAVDPSFEWGNYVLKLNYTDGTYALISSEGYGEICDENGEVIDVNHYGCNEKEWNRLIKKYLPDKSDSPEPGQTIKDYLTESSSEASE